MPVKVSRQNIAEHLFEQQLIIVNKTVQEAIKDNKWREWEITQEQYEKFKTFSIALIKRVFKCNRTRAEKTFNFFFLQFGLKIN